MNKAIHEKPTEAPKNVRKIPLKEKKTKIEIQIQNGVGFRIKIP